MLWEPEYISVDDFPTILIAIYVVPALFVNVVACEVIPQHSGLHHHKEREEEKNTEKAGNILLIWTNP